MIRSVILLLAFILLVQIKTPSVSAQEILSRQAELVLEVEENVPSKLTASLYGKNALIRAEIVNNAIKNIDCENLIFSELISDCFDLISLQKEMNNEIVESLIFLEKRNILIKIIFGNDYESINILYKTVEENNRQIEKMIVLLGKIENESGKEGIRNLIGAISNQNVSLKNRINFESSRLVIIRSIFEN